MAREILRLIVPGLPRMVGAPDVVIAFISEEMRGSPEWAQVWSGGEEVPALHGFVRCALIAGEVLRGHLKGDDGEKLRAAHRAGARSVLAIAGDGLALTRIPVDGTKAEVQASAAGVASRLALVVGSRRQKRAHIRRAIEENLRTCTLPHLDRASAPGVLVVGSGPTLDLGRVAAAHAAGLSIWTTNTAARAVCSVVTPDVVVVRESLNVAQHLVNLRNPPRVIAVDLCAHPDVWRIAGDRGAFFVPDAADCDAARIALAVRAFSSGSSSLVSAVALAAQSGARWIGLEGVDLAFARDGRGYSPTAQYAFNLARLDGELATFSAGDAQRALADLSGEPRPPPREEAPLVSAREGAPLRSIRPWLAQIEDLERVASTWTPGATLWRGLGLAHINGWVDAPLVWSEVPTGAVEIVTHPTGPLRTSASFIEDLEGRAT